MKTLYSKNVLIYKTPKDVQDAIKASISYSKSYRDYWSIEILEGEAHGCYHGFRDKIEAKKYAGHFENFKWKPTING